MAGSNACCFCSQPAASEMYGLKSIIYGSGNFFVAEIAFRAY
jgi:hypothetical protein